MSLPLPVVPVFPESGLVTSRLYVPAEVSAGTVSVKVVLETNAIVALVPLIVAVQPVMKPVPVMVLAPPAVVTEVALTMVGVLTGGPWCFLEPNPKPVTYDILNLIYCYSLFFEHGLTDLPFRLFSAFLALLSL